MNKEKGIRKIKNPYIRQILNTAVLLGIVFWLSNGTATVEGEVFGNIEMVKTYMFAGIFAVYLLCVIVIYFLKDATLKKIDMYPMDFEEGDEREAMITANAARRSFVMMEFILGGGAIFVMFGNIFAQRAEFKLVAITMAILYVVMHVVFLTTMKKEKK